jgi:hypothetical protein
VPNLLGRLVLFACSAGVAFVGLVSWAAGGPRSGGALLFFAGVFCLLCLGAAAAIDVAWGPPRPGAGQADDFSTGPDDGPESSWATPRGRGGDALDLQAAEVAPRGGGPDHAEARVPVAGRGGASRRRPVAH